VTSSAKPVLGADVVFDKQRAADALDAFAAGQLSALAVAGHLPSALKRVEELEDTCRMCLGLLEWAPHPTLTLKAIAQLEACLRSALRSGEDLTS
jgi:hypothetical protein